MVIFFAVQVSSWTKVATQSDEVTANKNDTEAEKRTARAGLPLQL
jgi:hypothetical protein